ncbi:MAG: AI-2E family transporter, partial [Verrucomicrobiales bacterium]|nr:AI-2E family transporter [Verrucomicrobiales bacterium]
MKPIPTRFQKKTLWSALTALGIVLIGAIAVGAIMMLGEVLSYLQPVLVPLAVAGIIAYLLEPVIIWISKKWRWKHSIAMLVVYITFLLFMAGLVIAVVVPTLGQAQEFVENREEIQGRVVKFFNDGYRDLQEKLGIPEVEKYAEKGVTWLSEEGPEIGKKIGMWIWGKLRGAFGFFGYLLGLLLVPIYLFYFLREGHTISNTWSDYLPLRASDFKDEVVGTLKEINQY